MQCLLRPPETDRDNYGNNRVQKKGAAITELVHRLSSLRLLRPCPDMSIAPSMSAEYGFGEGSGDRIEGCLLLQGFCVLRNLPCCCTTVTRFDVKGKGSARRYFVFFFVRFIPFLSTLPTPFAPTQSPHLILNMAGPKLEVFKVQELETCFRDRESHGVRVDN